MKPALRAGKAGARRELRRAEEPIRNAVDMVAMAEECSSLGKQFKADGRVCGVTKERCSVGRSELMGSGKKGATKNNYPLGALPGQLLQTATATAVRGPNKTAPDGISSPTLARRLNSTVIWGFEALKASRIAQGQTAAAIGARDKGELPGTDCFLSRLPSPSRHHFLPPAY